MKILLFVLSLACGLTAYAQNIAIIDNGIDASYYSRYTSLLKKEACFSLYADDGVIRGGIFSNTESILYRTLSVCKNGNSEQTSGTRASSLPRAVAGERYNGNYLYTTVPRFLGSLTHNAYVLEAARSAGAYNGQIINIMTRSFENTSSNPNNYTFASNFKLGSSRVSTDRLALDFVASRAFNDRINVVSYSSGFGLFSNGCSGPYDSTIATLRSRDILLIAASGNNYSTTGMAYPSCKSNVVSVGGMFDYNRVLGDTNFALGLDFLTNGVIGPIPPLVGVRTGSSMAAPRVAAYFGRLKQRHPSKNMGQIWTALGQAGNRYSRNGVIAWRVYETDFLQADTILRTNQVPNPPPPVIPPTPPPVPVIDYTEYLFGEVNKGAYGKGFGSDSHGNGYGVNIILSEVASTTSSSAQALQRTNNKISESQLIAQSPSTCGTKYKFRYKIYDIDYDGEVRVFLNNKELAYIKATGDRQLASRKIEFCGNLLNVGKNKFEFRLAAANREWGVKDIALEFVDKGKINITVGQKDSGSYGYGFGSNEHRSQLIVNFTNPNNGKDLELSLKGWDIDLADENKVYLNYRLLGYLSKGCSSCFNNGDKFIIKSEFLNAGTNEIVFIQRNPDATWNGFQNEKWGVTDLLIKQKGGDITAAVKLLLLDE